jgi:hypothetical protein
MHPFSDKYKLGHHIHPFPDRSTNRATTCIHFQTEIQIRPTHSCIFRQKYKSGHHMHHFQTEVQIRPPHASIFRHKYKLGHHMHPFPDRSTNQATTCMYFKHKYKATCIYFQTEVQIRPPHACISSINTNHATCMYFHTEVQIRPPHASIFRQKYTPGHHYIQKEIQIRQPNAWIHRQKYKPGHPKCTSGHTIHSRKTYAQIISVWLFLCESWWSLEGRGMVGRLGRYLSVHVRRWCTFSTIHNNLIVVFRGQQPRKRKDQRRHFTSLSRFPVQVRLCWRLAWTEKCGPTGRRFPYTSPSITTARRQSNQLG